MGLPEATAVALDDIIVERMGSLNAFHAWSTPAALRAFHPFTQGGLGFASCAAMRTGAIAASWPLCLQDVIHATGLTDLFELALRARPSAPVLQAILASLLTHSTHAERFST